MVFKAEKPLRINKKGLHSKLKKKKQQAIFYHILDHKALFAVH